MASPTAGVVAAVERGLTARRPKARYVVGAAPKVQAVMARFTPTRVLDAAMRAATGTPRKP